MRCASYLNRHNYLHHDLPIFSAWWWRSGVEHWTLSTTGRGTSLHGCCVCGSRPSNIAVQVTHHPELLSGFSGWVLEFLFCSVWRETWNHTCHFLSGMWTCLKVPVNLSRFRCTKCFQICKVKNHHHRILWPFILRISYSKDNKLPSPRAAHCFCFLSNSQ